MQEAMSMQGTVYFKRRWDRKRHLSAIFVGPRPAVLFPYRRIRLNLISARPCFTTYNSAVRENVSISKETYGHTAIFPVLEYRTHRLQRYITRIRYKRSL